MSSPFSPLPDPARYPLSWPLAYPRASERRAAAFRASFASARTGLLEELRLLGAEAVTLSSNVELRRDGLPYAGRTPADPGLAVYFTWQGRPYAVACDCWLKVEENLQAVRLTVAALRGIARWGSSELLAAAFAGFKALPVQAGPSSGSAWWVVLGLADSEATPAEVNAAYRRLARERHPDAGGSQVLMTELNEARRQGLGQKPTQEPAAPPTSEAPAPAAG